MKKSQVTKVAKAVGGGWRFLVAIVFSWCWLGWGSQIARVEAAYTFQTFPEENSGDPMGYAQAQIEIETWECLADSMGRVAPTSRAANIDYVCFFGRPLAPPDYPPPEIINTPWASSVSIVDNCGGRDWSARAMNYLTLTLKATVQPGFVFDHWEVVGSNMDLSDFTDVTAPEATIELCELINHGGSSGDYVSKTGFDPNAQFQAVFKSASSPPTPTPTPEPAVTPPTDNGDSNGDGGGSTTPPSAPQCHGNKPADPAPYITHSTSGGPGSITLHYQLGGKPYTKYLVEYGYVNASFTFGTTITNPEAGSVTINDLTPGTTYQFRLIPANDCAAGTPSNTFPVAVGGLPKVPGVPNTGW